MEKLLKRLFEKRFWVRREGDLVCGLRAQRKLDGRSIPQAQNENGEVHVNKIKHRKEGHRRFT